MHAWILGCMDAVKFLLTRVVLCCVYDVRVADLQCSVWLRMTLGMKIGIKY